MGSFSSCRSERSSGPQTAQSRTPRLTARMPSCWALGSDEPISWSRPVTRGLPARVGAEQVGQHGVLVPVGDRVEPQDRTLGARVELGEAQLQLVVGAGLVAPHGDVVGNGSVALGQRRVGSVADPAQPDVVGVGVEDHDPQGGLGEHPLEQEAERVGLPRARLPAHEGVPVEPTTVELGRDAGCQHQLADDEAGPVPTSGPVEPGAHLVGWRRAGLCVVEGSPLVEEEALADGRADQHAGGRAVGAGELHVRCLPGQVGDLTEPAPAVVLEHDVGPSPERQPVERRLELERAAVDRRGQREQGPLDAVTDVAVASDLLGQRVAAARGAVSTSDMSIHPCRSMGSGERPGATRVSRVSGPATRVSPAAR